jgi:sugar phosphate isomerase/epimerase
MIMRTFAVSSWSLDGLLQSGLPLLRLPAQLAEHGITTLELCHFHLPSTEPGFLRELRRALDDAGVTLYSILIDTGDITAPDPAQRAADVAAIERWIGVAAALGARVVRVDAGLQPPTPEAIAESARQLRPLALAAEQQGLRAITENWHATSREPSALLAILEQCGGKVGLCADTGNAEATADKYATLAQLLPHASSVHFKARYGPDGSIEMGDLGRCCALIEQAGFAGVITLIYAGKRTEWAEIGRLRAAVAPLLAAA